MSGAKSHFLISFNEDLGEFWPIACTELKDSVSIRNCPRHCLKYNEKIPSSQAYGMYTSVSLLLQF